MDEARQHRRFQLDDLYALKLPSDPQLSPEGGEVAFVITRADREADENLTTIWSVGPGGGPPTPLTSRGHETEPRWSPDGRTIAYLAPVEPDGLSQIWLMDRVSGSAEVLTDLPGGAGTPVWSPDGSKLAFSQKPRSDRTSKDPIVIERLGYKEDGVGLRPTIGDNLYVADVSARRAELLVDGGGFVAPMVDFVSTPVWSPDGTRMANSWSPPGDELPYTYVTFVISLDDGEPVPVTDPMGFLLVQDWSPHGGELLVWGQQRYVGERYQTKLYVVPVGGGELRPVAPGLDRTVASGARFAGSGERVVFSANDRGTFPLMVAPVHGDGPARAIVDGPSAVWQLSIAGDRVACVVLDPTTCGEIETLSLDGSDRERLTDLFAAALPDVSLFEAKERTFISTDGQTVHGWVISPDVEGATPAVLSIHGGPHLAWGPAFDQFHLYQQTMAAKGWTVLMVNPRGSDGYGERYLQNGAWGVHDVDDLIAALDSMIDDGSVDGGRVAVTGYSYGGYLTCLITALRDRFAAAVAGGVITDLPSSMWSSDLGLFEISEHDSDPWSHPDVWRERSPIDRVQGVRCPTLILHGEADDRCPFNQAEAWFLALRRQGVPTQLVAYPDASHSFQWAGKPSHRIDYCRRIEDWFENYVEGVDTEADPEAGESR
jgi:dipeptidyl aminopeptidase/acylaminoacyl peptidase